LEHAYLLELFCKKLSEAIAAMRMRQQALRAFFIDELTGLPDARYLYSNVEQELAKAKHDKSQLSLLALDLDEFKRINKQYGFQAGDQVLRTAAIALRNSCRETDTLVRYAGNEFITVLRNTGPLEAQILMSRLQHVIANLKPRLETTTRVAVRLNVGHSSYPDDGNTLEELLSQAERRMYDNGIKHSRKVSRPLRKRVGKQPDLS
jgi:diguanylate cyclase (GGDEF)-like protein